MADSPEAHDPDAQVSEAQIAVHWREEEYYPPPASFVAQASAADPAIFGRFAEDKYPGCFKEYADLLAWDAPWHHAGHVQPAILEVVYRRQAERLI